ncbi:hypothetical protein [Bacillus sp. SD088]|uniref:hypothetical protein n=1 Tax=Bacillus sp. SD088 TaxID=2782012 RepID=UPI001A96E661|nr:hypothetical protein [Bacillus sp. SD088]MBO0992739.1 hypothetical protein [Bacillus sp. SD088]
MTGTKISMEEAHLAGVDVNFERMGNGEKRFRLVSTDGSSYCRTIASERGGWQNSHYHKVVSEFYVVQSGWIVYAEISSNGALNVSFLHEGESVTVKPFVHHNIFLPPHAVIHTIKYGDGSTDIDWFPSKELDQHTQNLSEDDLLKMGKKD